MAESHPSFESTQTDLSPAELASLLVYSPGVFLETLTELDGSPFVLEPYQIRLLNDHSYFRLVNKSRQIGFSTVIAAEGFHKAAIAPLIRKPYEANYISVNQKEAGAKIEIVRRLYHSISDEFKGGDLPLKPELWTDSQFEIEFGRPPHQGTLVSQPASSAVRGGRKDIYFDEFAHIRDAKKLYQAALPAITRGDSRITIVSTPLGQSGLFYDIATDVDAYPEYSRHSVPWWESRAMVKPGWYEEALACAADLPTVERVEKYGSDKLNSIFRSFGEDLIGFQTEYEATFVDEAEAYFPWDLIVSCRNTEAPIWRDWPDGYESEGWLAIGMDLAKERDTTVIVVSEIKEIENETHRKVLFVKALHSSYEDQFQYLKRLVARINPHRVSIDQTGVGHVFVERAKREIAHRNIEGVVFTNQKKEKWATSLKGDMQLRLVEWPAIPELQRQIHGIRRTKTEANFYKFSGQHDDYFWAMVLSFYGEGRVPVRMYYI